MSRLPDDATVMLFELQLGHLVDNHPWTGPVVMPHDRWIAPGPSRLTWAAGYALCGRWL